MLTELRVQLQHSYGSSRTPSKIEVFVNQFEYASARPSILNYAEVRAVLGAKLERAMLLQKTPEDALRDAANVAQAALND